MNARTTNVFRSWPLFAAVLMYVTRFAAWASYTVFYIYAVFHIKAYFSGVPLKLAFFALNSVSGLIIAFGFPLSLLSLRPRTRHPRVTAVDQPLLFESVQKIATLCGHRPPLEVKLTMDPTISLSPPGMFVRDRRTVIEIGLPLVQLLTVSQFEAALAHAMFFCHRKNWLAVRLLQRSRRSVDTAQFLNSALNPFPFPVLSKFYAWYEGFCSRVVRLIVANYQLTADESVAHAMGSNVLASALRTVVENQLALYHYIYEVVLPVVERGCYPPLIEGFRTYVEVGANKTSPNDDDEGPTLQQRLAAIEHFPAGPEDCTPAIDLLFDVPKLEALALLAESNTTAEKLRPTVWGQVGQFVILPKWEEECARYSTYLEPLTLDELPKAVAQGWYPDILAKALGLLLCREGWYIDYRPGYLRICRGEEAISPKNVIEDMSKPEFTRQKWNEMLKQWKLDLSLPLREA
jgi:hypothetical protein